MLFSVLSSLSVGENPRDRPFYLEVMGVLELRQLGKWAFEISGGLKMSLTYNRLE